MAELSHVDDELRRNTKVDSPGLKKKVKVHIWLVAGFAAYKSLVIPRSDKYYLSASARRRYIPILAKTNRWNL